MRKIEPQVSSQIVGQTWFAMSGIAKAYFPGWASKVVPQKRSHHGSPNNILVTIFGESKTSRARSLILGERIENFAFAQRLRIDASLPNMHFILWQSQIAPSPGKRPASLQCWRE
jgi:hypothetical protein